MSSRRKTKKTVWGYAGMRDAEEWHGASTRAAATEAALENVRQGVTHEAWIHEGAYPDPAQFLPDTTYFREQMDDSAADNGCLDSIDDPFRERTGAEKALNKVLTAWARKYLRPNFWLPVGEPIRVDVPA